MQLAKGLCVPLAVFLTVDVCLGILLDAACCRSLLKSALHRDKAEVYSLQRYNSNDAPDSWLISAHTYIEQKHRHAMLNTMVHTLCKQIASMLCCSIHNKAHTASTLMEKIWLVCTSVLSNCTSVLITIAYACRVVSLHLTERALSPL
jgi:hypothetical protein